MNPALIQVKDGGNGPTDWPPETAIVAPRNASIPASVTMKDGMPQ